MNIEKHERSEVDIKRSRQRCVIDGKYYNLPIKLFEKLETMNGKLNQNKETKDE